jgi:hypothetical protein
MRMFNVNTKPKLFQYATLGFDHLIFCLVVILIDRHWLNDFARANLFNVIEYVHDVSYAFGTFFNFATQEY